MTDTKVAVTGNPYLTARQERYTKLLGDTRELQLRAAKEQRDLTDDELSTIKTNAQTLSALGDEITELSNLETRSLAVANLSAALGTIGQPAADDKGTDVPTIGADGKQLRAAGTDDKGEKLTGNAATQDRDPGHYRSVREGGQHSFFSDMAKAKEEGTSSPSGVRLADWGKHTRALSNATAGVGLVPPKWLTEEYEKIPRQIRAVAEKVRRIDLGDDPRPMTLPKQTAGTDAVVAEQAAENDPVLDTDAYDSDVETVTPKPTSGAQKVSRQMIDMDNPAIDSLIYSDLMSVYDFKVELKVCAAMIAAAGAAVVTLANEGVFQDQEGGAIDAVIDTSIEVWANQFAPADLVFGDIRRFGKFRKLKDLQGRPIVPMTRYSLQNAAGQVITQQSAEVEGLDLVGTAGAGTGLTYPQKVVVARAADTLFFESAVMRFRYEEPDGPETIKLGVWGYTAVLVRQGHRSTKCFQITAAGTGS